MSSELAIRARGLGKAYRLYARPRDRLWQAFYRGRRLYHEHWALRPIDLDVQRGETVAIVGRNGSGKSTFLQLVCGTLTPTCGEVSVRGRIAPLLQLGAGFHPDFSGRENVYLSGAILGLERREIDERFESIAAFADIGEFMDQPVSHYSSGMYARLAFSAAAHVDADILVVDEILAVGDAAFTQKCMRFIRGFRERGTLFFVSHDVSAVLSLCDRAVWLDGGELRAIGPARDVCRDYEASLQIRDDEVGGIAVSGSPRSAGDTPVRDPRADLLAGSVHRNELELFEFDDEGPQYGYGRARIERVEILDAEGRALPLLAGGEIVQLVVTARVLEPLARPIVGFVLKDRLGQMIFSDNTWLSHRDRPVPAAGGQQLRATFRFQLPYLPSGDFAVSAAIADGTQVDHVQHHWLDDALLFKVHASHVARGLVGVPMLAIELETEPAERTRAGQREP